MLQFYQLIVATAIDFFIEQTTKEVSRQTDNNYSQKL